MFSAAERVASAAGQCLALDAESTPKDGNRRHRNRDIFEKAGETSPTIVQTAKSRDRYTQSKAPSA